VISHNSPFFGAAGLKVQAAAHEAAQQRATALRLVCGTRAVTRPLAVVGLDHNFETYHDLETRCTQVTGLALPGKGCGIFRPGKSSCWARRSGRSGLQVPMLRGAGI
jgi:hypothetical protein